MENTIFVDPKIFETSNHFFKKFYDFRVTDKVLIISDDTTNWDSILNKIQSYKDLGNTLKLITSINIPKEVVWKLGYDANNILQININLLNNKFQSWIPNVISISEKCGILSELFLYPIMYPTVRTPQVLQIMESTSNFLHCIIRLKFLEISDSKISKENSNELVQADNMFLERRVWKCDPEYISNFLKYIMFFAKFKKINVVQC